MTVLDQRQCNGWEQRRSVDGGGHGEGGEGVAKHVYSIVNEYRGIEPPTGDEYGAFSAPGLVGPVIQLFRYGAYICVSGLRGEKSKM